ncbi:MAG: DUF6049 family protein, partial [Jatrophihabitantaceae bacterium]
ITDVFPNSPAITSKPAPLRFTLTLTNTSHDALKDVVISADRSDPIGSQAALDATLAAPKAPSDTQVAPVRTTVKIATLPVGTTTVLFRTTTDVASDRTSVLLGANAIYPFWFAARHTDSAGAVTDLATAQTYVPAFLAPPVKTTVSWLWPLLDRPHRLARGSVFLDDGLADEVKPGGRLDQLLQVIKSVAPTVPLTIVTDPDLIDSLTVMSTGYQVYADNGTTTRGTNGSDAKRWLGELHDILAAHPKLEVVFTPLADPAVDSLTRNGISWSQSLDPGVQNAVSAVLGNHTSFTDIAWPVGQAIGPATLDNLVTQGANTIVLADRLLTGGGQRPAATALAPLQTPSGPALAAVTSTPIERLVAGALDPVGPGLELLPRLVAELAVRVVASLDVSHHVVIAPPRNLSVDPAVAARVIEATANTTWSTPVPLHAAVGSSAITPADQGTLRTDQEPLQLPTRVVRSLRYVTDSLPTLSSLFADAALRAGLYATFPAAVQRCESTSLLTDRGRARTMAKTLEDAIRRTRAGVSIVPPSDGTYTLTSTNSQLPVTVVNRLNARIRVRIAISTVSGGGFTAGQQNKIFTINPNSKVQEHIPTHVDHVGRIEVKVEIATPDGLPLGTA